MKPPTAPSLLEVIRLLLHKIEEGSYPKNDPTCIENLKAYLRCRIAELQVEGVLRLPSTETSERFTSVYKDDWWLPRSQRSRSVSLESLEEDISIQNGRVRRTELSVAK
jgi:hypothetical protein